LPLPFVGGPGEGGTGDGGGPVGLGDGFDIGFPLGFCFGGVAGPPLEHAPGIALIPWQQQAQFASAQAEASLFGHTML